ncbi:MAG: ABC transporter permease [Burkholderiales bacterium]|nr:ABC transporter permease [Burkholderiales bacterium]
MLGLALRNVVRHRVRTAITLGAIVFGVVGLVLSGGFVHDMFRQLAEVIIHSQTGHIQVAKRGFFTFGSRSPEKYTIADPAAVEKTLAARPEVADVMGRVHFSGLLNNGRTDLSIIGEGIEPGKEAKLGTYLVIREGRALAAADAFGMLIGQGVADSLKLKPGERATILLTTAEGAMNTLDFDVVGVFQTFSKDYDARAVKIPLAAAQELLNTPGVNLVVVSLGRTRDTGASAAAIRAGIGAQGLEVKAWSELNDFYDKTVDLYDRQFGVLRLIILAMVLLSVVNSVNMSLFERVGEFGTMRALGNRGRDLFLLVITEGAVLGIAGALLGTLVGIVLAIAISAIGIPMPPPPNANLGYTARILVVPSVVASAFLVGFAATVLGSVLPALRVSRMPVVAALRQNV